MQKLLYYICRWLLCKTTTESDRKKLQQPKTRHKQTKTQPQNPHPFQYSYKTWKKRFPSCIIILLHSLALLFLSGSQFAFPPADLKIVHFPGFLFCDTFLFSFTQRRKYMLDIDTGRGGLILWLLQDISFQPHGPAKK